ncbi:sensor histidine kinase [Nostoc sphaeroides CHAB 2801]|nr:sensor histidine kinase [Nostoc sphaeroides]MCC5627920.1 sensor histidine kinase [Nostoc sphaeroides CHAB 2801]
MIGIPPDEIKHIFEPFHRASNASNIPGMGLVQVGVNTPTIFKDCKG